MADVFISYKRADRSAAKTLAMICEAHGFSTWWDSSLIAGEQFNAAIQRELKSAGCVLVLWTEASHASRFVQAEAMEGFARGALVAARLDDVKVGYPFGIIQTADLRGWGETPRHSGIDEAVTGIAMLLGRTLKESLALGSGRFAEKVRNMLSEHDQGRAALIGMAAYERVYGPLKPRKPPTKRPTAEPSGNLD